MPSPAPHAALLALIHEVASQPDEAHTLQTIVDLAVSSIDGCTWAGVTLNRTGRLTTASSSAPIVEQADELQYDLREGPCIDAACADAMLLVADTADESRWPRWAPAARALGIRSVLSVHLSTPTETVGGLNLYADHHDAFDDDAMDMAVHYAAHAAAVAAVAHQIGGLQTALRTRHAIGVAQGVLVAKHDLTVDQAFTVLIRLSRCNNVKLKELADQVVTTRGIPNTMLANG